jgi:hypothetical protein
MGRFILGSTCIFFRDEKHGTITGFSPESKPRDTGFKVFHPLGHQNKKP